MLSLSFIRNNRDLIIERLNKRNFDSKKLVDKIIKFDLERRKIIAGPERATNPNESNCAIIFQLII